MAVSSAPEAGLVSSTGASATASTVTVRLSVVVAVSPFASVVVALTVRSMVPEKSCGGVIVRSASWPGVRVTLPSALTVPADRTAPSGMLSMVTDVVPSETVTSRAMAVSSSPAVLLVASSGASATASTATALTEVVVAVSPFSSVAVAVTVRAMAPLKSAGGVSVRPAS